MRKVKKESELKELAKKISESIVIRTEVDGTSKDTRRETTSLEKKILHRILYAALLAMNEALLNCRDEKEYNTAACAIVNAAEYTTKQFITECNGYLTVYIPLNTVLDEWEKEDERA